MDKQRCIVPGCLSNRSAKSHVLPKDLSRGSEWIRAVRNPKLATLTYDSIRRSRYCVCHRHFDENSWVTTYSLPRLKHNAIPTLHLPDDPSSIDTKDPDEGIDASNVFAKTDVRMDCNPVLSTLSPTVKYTKSPTIKDAVPQARPIPMLPSLQSTSACNVTTTILPMEIDVPLVPRNVVESLLVQVQDHDEKLDQMATASTAENVPMQITPQKTRVQKRRRSLLGDDTRMENLTPKAKRLYIIAKDLTKQQYKSNMKLKRYRTRLKDAIKYSKDKSNVNFAHLSRAQRVLLEMQLRNSQYKARGRRFTVEEKIMALSLYKRSPRCYRFMAHIWVLPSPVTLRQLMRKIPSDTGLNHTIIRHLEETARNMKDQKDKVCLLMWDEMYLKPHIQYDLAKDKIVGFEDYAHRRTHHFADHVLVFMLRGISRGWKMSLSYYYCESQTKGPELTRLIKDHITAVTKAGLTVVATVCDQGSSNITAINKLILEHCMRTGTSDRRQIEIKNCKLVPLFDPPHLLKGIRNNLVTKNLEIDYRQGKPVADRKYATWQHIDLAYEMDIHSCTMNRAMPKLTDEHVKIDKMRKMKVKIAAQVLSRTVSLFMELCCKFNGSLNTRVGELKMPPEAINTSYVCDFFNKLFDSTNGHSLKPETLYRVAVSDRSPHLEFWNQAREILNKMTFIDRKTNKPTSVPSLNNWIVTIDGMQKLWGELSSMGFKYLKPRTINQDPLENFFGTIRSHGQRYTSPTCWQFDGLFKTLLVNNLSSQHSIGGNCEKDDGDFIFTSIQNILKNRVISNDEEREVEIQAPDLLEATPKYEPVTRLGNATRMYTAGWMARKLFRCIKDIRDCILCKNSLLASNTNTVEYEGIRVREYKKMKPSLAYANLDFFERGFVRAENILKRSLPQECFKTALGARLRQKLATRMDFEWLACKKHRKIVSKKFCFLMVKIHIFHWSIVINRILSGRDTRKRANNVIVREALKKCLAIRSRNMVQKRNLQ